MAVKINSNLLRGNIAHWFWFVKRCIPYSRVSPKINSHKFLDCQTDNNLDATPGENYHIARLLYCKTRTKKVWTQRTQIF